MDIMEDAAPDASSPIDSDAQLRYRVWKKNAPLLYDYLQTSSLVWPSLSVQWFPDVERDSGFYKERLLVGSYSNGASAFENLQLLSVRIPGSRLSLDECDFDPERQEFVFNDAHYQENKVTISQRIPHVGDVNRAKVMPQNPDMLATISNDGSVSIFDRTKKSLNYDEDELIREKNMQQPGQEDTTDLADIKLKFHTAEGWGLDWNKFKQGELASGANDGCLAIWDIRDGFTRPDRLSTSATAKKKFKTCTMSPKAHVAAHDFGINSVAYLWHHDSLLGTAGEDGRVKVFDTRTMQPVLETKRPNAINTLDFNKQNQFGLALGDDKGHLYVEDLRSLEEPVLTLDAHTSAVSAVTWNYEFGNVVASSSSDGLVKIWRLGSEDTRPVFVHGGHMLGVSDVSWNPNDPWMLASCADDNSVQIWKPASTIL